MHPEFAPIAFLSAISVLIVLPWHWRAGNVATLALAFWLFISNIIYGVDASIWGNNVEIVVPIWCDITSKLIIGTNFALPSACLCICVHLEQVASVRLANSTMSDKRRRQIFEALMCFGLPIFFMGLHFVVQGHRFDIIEEYGCRPTTYFSIPSLFIVWLPPLVVSLVALVFAGLALRHFMLRRISFAAHLSASHSALTTSRYLRLMLMAALQMVWSLTITAYAVWFTAIAVPLRPWTTWADVHSDFSRIDQYPSLFTPQVILTGYYVLWWMVPVSTLIFVAFFAFGRDAVDEYKKCFIWFRTRVLRLPVATAESAKGSFTSMPKLRFGKSKLKDTTNTGTTSTLASLPPYVAPIPPSPSQFKSNHSDYNDSRSEVSNYESGIYSYSHDRKSLGSLTDLSSTSPTTFISPVPWSQPNNHNNIPMIPLTPPSPLTPPPPPHPRIRAPAGFQSPTSPRPFTYPSHDFSHRAINLSKLDIA